jgi:hypothetical protein
MLLTAAAATLAPASCARPNALQAAVPLQPNTLGVLCARGAARRGSAPAMRAATARLAAAALEVGVTGVPWSAYDQR